MRKRNVKSIFVLIAAATLLSFLYGQSQHDVWKPKRINRVIELWESGQPVYYTSARGGFEEGVKAAQTWADYINYDMEHSPYDVAALRVS